MTLFFFLNLDVPTDESTTSNTTISFDHATPVKTTTEPPSKPADHVSETTDIGIQAEPEPAAVHIVNQTEPAAASDVGIQTTPPSTTDIVSQSGEKRVTDAVKETAVKDSSKDELADQSTDR